MKTQKISLKQKFTVLTLSIFIISINPAIARSDKEMMADVQKARQMKRKDGDHVEHFKPLEKDQQFRGVYYGYLPCETCAGIKMTLSLKHRKNYLLVTQYAQASNKEFYEKGKYDWNEKTNTLTLTAKKNVGVRKFRIKDESTIIKLKKDGMRMEGNQDKYALTRSDKNKAREVHIH